MPNEIKSIHVTFAKQAIQRVSDLNFDELDQWLALGAYCIKHDIKPTDLARATYDQWEFAVKFGTAKNKLASATAIVGHFGSVKNAENAINAYNAKNTACADPQTLAKKFGLQKANKPSPSVDCIDQLVLDGHLSVKHAKFLKANGYMIVKK